MPHKQLFVKDVTACRAKDLYGYSKEFQCFLKIRLLSLNTTAKCAELLRSGEVLGTQFTCYEAHIPFLLSFLADYSLAGCDWLEFDTFIKKTQVSESKYEIFVSVNSILNPATSAANIAASANSANSGANSAIEIDSLAQVRLRDTQWRESVGMSPWTPLNMTPSFQTKARDWEWTLKQECLSLLNQRLDSVTESPSVPVNIDYLPTPGKLVQKTECTYDVSTQLKTSTQKTHSQQSQSSVLSLISTDGELDGVKSTIEQIPGLQSSERVITPLSPSTNDVVKQFGITQYTKPFYSNPADVELTPVIFGNKEVNVRSHEPKDLQNFYIVSKSALTSLVKPSNWCQLALPFSPSTNDVTNSEQTERSSKKVNTQLQSTLYSVGSLESQELDTEEMSVLIIEILPSTRRDKAPVSSTDAINALFWQFGTNNGVITSQKVQKNAAFALKYVESELGILNEFISLVFTLNPDIVAGYETNKMSLGYARARYSILTGTDTFFTKLGRPYTHHSEETLNDENMDANMVNETIYGRLVFNLWNLFRKDLTLNQYSLENLVLHLFRETTPNYSYETLHEWWMSGDLLAVGTVVNYCLNRLQLSLKVLAYLEIIDKTSSMARILGLDFNSVLTRGSQFRVESILCRLTRKQDYLLISPSKAQVSRQNALEYIPLVMEPVQQFYTDPVCVLDFRSLYPSLIIAFNLCYSTCLGRVKTHSQESSKSKLGIKNPYELDYSLLKNIGLNNVYIAPNNMVYVNPNIRKSLLGTMLGEILDTRFMLQSSRKNSNTNRRLRNLNNQQLAMKLIANVTYGYTSASFSGRMPLADLADSIVLCGREILEFCIAKIQSTEFHGVQPSVVYGDTDSLFVKLPNVSLDQAFVIGGEIAELVTSSTPDPILLKLEKVYLPCILLSKKRYVGRSFENAKAPPKFDAKGTETIRRDGVKFLQKLEKTALNILFDSADLSLVKSYLQTQWTKLLSGDVSVQDLCFQQQVKLGSYKNTSNLPGGAVVSLKRMQTEGYEPEYNERVPYVVVSGPPNSKLRDRAVHPKEMIRNNRTHGGTGYQMLDAEYYIHKVLIPPLERLFEMTGANIGNWYATMPKTSYKLNSNSLYFASAMCVVCMQRQKQKLDVMCVECRANEPNSMYILARRKQHKETQLGLVRQLCATCSGHVPPESFGRGYEVHPCESLDCSWYFERETVLNEFLDMM